MRLPVLAFVLASCSLLTRADEPSFELDVVPILSKAGCNGGGCHGALAGKAGFRLSLFGYDPQSDFIALTRDARILIKPNATADVFVVSLDAIVTAVTNALESGMNDQLYARCAYLWIREYRPADDGIAEAAWRISDNRAYAAVEEYGQAAVDAILAFGKLVMGNRIDAGGSYISEEEEQALIDDDRADLDAPV